jgi:hypothetical protein
MNTSPALPFEAAVVVAEQISSMSRMAANLVCDSDELLFGGVEFRGHMMSEDNMWEHFELDPPEEVFYECTRRVHASCQ